MESTEIVAQLRTNSGKGVARKIRAKGLIPAVLYGKTEQNVLLELDPKQLDQVFNKKSGLNTVIKLKVGEGESYTTLLKAYQADQLTRKLTHADFVKLDLTKTVEAEIPIEIVGKAEGVKEGGILELITRRMSVKALPTALPNSLPVDVTSLKVGQSIHSKEIKLPEGVSWADQVNYTIVSIVAPKEEKVTAAPADAAKEPEVLTAKKAPEEKAEGKSDKK